MTVKFISALWRKLLRHVILMKTTRLNLHILWLFYLLMQQSCHEVEKSLNMQVQTGRLSLLIMFLIILEGFFSLMSLLHFCLMKSISVSDFDQLPLNIPVSAAIADVEEKKGFIDYYVSTKKLFT